jgi:hypothetical protein
MRQTLYPLKVRYLIEQDESAFLSLEEKIWKAKGIETATAELFRRWRKNGILLGCFEEEKLLGYAYGERISFSPAPPYSAALLAGIEDYKRTTPDPHGNALHGISMAATRPGAGAGLLEKLVEEARSESLRYFVSLARLAGLGRFVEKNSGTLQDHNPLEVAVLYAIQAVSLVSPKLVGPPLKLLPFPESFPKLSRRDPVVSRFARIGKELWGVTPTSFEDPESLGYSALLVLPL